MIYCETKNYARVWEVNKPENKKYIDLKISTNRKEQDKTVYSSFYVRCLGKACNTLKDVKVKDIIVITKCRITCEKHRLADGTEKYLQDFAILDAEIQQLTQSNTSQQTQTEPITSSDDDDDFPF